MNCVNQFFLTGVAMTPFTSVSGRGKDAHRDLMVLTRRGRFQTQVWVRFRLNKWDGTRIFQTDPTGWTVSIMGSAINAGWGDSEGREMRSSMLMAETYAVVAKPIGWEESNG